MKFDSIFDPDEATYRVWKSASEREFHAYLDRDFRDCVVYAWLMGYSDFGGAMFELSPMEVVRWQMEERFGLWPPKNK